MLTLKELELTNFRSWKHLHLTDLDNKGLLLIQGSNGSGKSSIRQGFEYLILDKTSDSLSVDELPRDKKKECTLRCVIHKDDDIIEITKYRNHKKNGNKTILSINGNDDLTSTDRRVTQRNIEDVLEIRDNAVFISTIFSANSPSFPEVKDSDRKQIIYDALDLFKYNKYRDMATSKKDEVATLIQKSNNKEENLSERIASTAIEVDHLKTKRDRFKEDVRARIAKLLSEKDEFVIVSTDKLQKEFDDLQGSMIEFDQSKYSDKVEEYNEKLESKHKLNYTIDEIERDIDKVKSGTCPIFKDECDRLVQRSESVRNELTPKLHKFNNKLKSLEKKIDSIAEEIDTMDKDKEHNEEIRGKMSDINYRIEMIDNDNKHVEKNRKRIDDQIEAVSKEENPYIELISDKQEKIDKMMKEKEELVVKREELINKQQYYDFWKEGFSKAGIPSLKSDGLLEEIEDITNSYLSRIGDKMFVEISAQSELKSKDVREKISYSIHHPEKSITDFQSYSSGEQQRVKIADIFSFFDLIGKFNIMILDEVLERSLDSIGLEGVIDLLLMKVQDDNVGTIAVISHNDKIKDKFNNVLHVIKKNGISTLKEG